jgi:hypothetical protein
MRPSTPPAPTSAGPRPGLIALLLAAFIGIGSAALAAAEAPDRGVCPTPGCNTPIPEGCRYCPSCGVKIPEAGDTLCPKCRRVYGSDARFCQQCGVALQPYDPSKVADDTPVPGEKPRPKVLILVSERHGGRDERREADTWNRSESLLRKQFFNAGYPLVDLDEARQSLERGMDFYRLRGDDRVAQALALKLQCEVIVKGEVRIREYQAVVQDIPLDKVQIEADLAAVQAGAATVLAPLSESIDGFRQRNPDNLERFLTAQFPKFSEQIMQRWQRTGQRGQEIKVNIGNIGSARTFERITAFARAAQGVTEVKEVEYADIGAGSHGSFTVYFQGPSADFVALMTRRDTFQTFLLRRTREAGNEVFLDVEDKE